MKAVDQYLNIKLDDVDVLDLDKYPHLSSVKNMFIRGSVVRYVVLPQSQVDTSLLEDATRRGVFISFEWVLARFERGCFICFGRMLMNRSITEAANQASKAR